MLILGELRKKQVRVKIAYTQFELFDIFRCLIYFRNGLVEDRRYPELVVYAANGYAIGYQSLTQVD